MKGMIPWLLPILAPSVVLPIFFFLYVVPGRADFGMALLVSVALLALALVSYKIADQTNQRWGEGARGEFRVGEELEKLHKEGYYIFHDWQSGYGNVDHFIVGPQGIFVVETKADTGEITSDLGRLFRNGKFLPKDPISQVRGNAAKVSKLISDSGSRKPWVNPILCFSRAELRCYGAVNGVEIANIGSLRRTIINYHVKSPYSPEEAKRVSHSLQEYLDVRPAAEPGTPPEAQSRWRELLNPERVFVVVYIVFILALSVVFHEATATFLEDIANLYRIVGTLLSASS